jgi:protein-S-isoprenylcysteine O-methyltransferase Ste14
VVAGLALHGIYDFIHPAVITNPGVPTWWPGFCLAYDVIAAAYLAALLLYKSRPMQFLELKVPPVPLVAIIAAAMFGLASLAPGATFSLTGRTSSAIALALIGITMALAGVLTFRAHRTTVNPLTPSASSVVVSNGVYSFSRNPMYLGFLLALAGWAVYLSNVLAALLLPAFVAYMNRFQIEPEERALLTKFGPSFAKYMAVVRRWL